MAYCVTDDCELMIFLSWGEQVLFLADAWLPTSLILNTSGSLTNQIAPIALTLYLAL